MKAQLLSILVQALLVIFNEKMMKDFVDSLLDFVEDAVKDSANGLDDAIVLPICDSIRGAFNIPDNDPVVSP